MARGYWTPLIIYRWVQTTVSMPHFQNQKTSVGIFFFNSSKVTEQASFVVFENMMSKYFFSIFRGHSTVNLKHIHCRRIQKIYIEMCL